MGLKDLFSNFFNTEHPIYISVLITVIVCLVCFIFIKYVLIPLRKRHKFEIEFKQAKLMALFAEANPNPLFRIDAQGMITHHNETAKELFDKDIIIGESVCNIFDCGRMDIASLIAGNKDYACSDKISGKFYSIYIKGIADLGIALVYMHDITFRHKYEENLRNFYDRLQDNIEAERKRISHELHDDIGAQLTEAKNSIIKQQPKEIIIDILDNAKRDLSNISRQLRPRILEEKGIKDALMTLCNTIAQGTGIKGNFSFNIKEERLDEKKELTLYRLAQESLTNITKHSKAAEFKVYLWDDDNIIFLNIIDNGIGIENLETVKSNFAGRGLGLPNMKERVEQMGGKFQIDSVPGKGTKLFFEIPKI